MANTLFIGKVYHREATLASTNDRARELLAKSKPPEGMVVRADTQSAGRGQFGSHWESEPGANLTLSVILYPHWLSAATPFALNLAVTLGVFDCLTSCLSQQDGPGPQPSIKWPNDLYLGDHKTGGILIENALSGTRIQSSIVGIGLNINQLAFRQAGANPISWALATGHAYQLDEVAETLFEGLERRYLQLKAGRQAGLQEEYHRHLYRYGVLGRYQRCADGTEFNGIIRGVDAAGRLLLETEGGREAFLPKQVSFLFDPSPTPFPAGTTT